jgi:endoglucanase
MVRKTFITPFLILCAVSIGWSQDFIQRQGKKLKYQGNDILLRGMAFGNLVWDDSYVPNQHHSEIDLKRVHDLGMNAIRFYMSYKTFEADANPYLYKQSGWDWIDQNIQWAKKHGVYLILNMHVPQGGFQSQCKGDALWTNEENRNRLCALWKAIASRYKNEPQIAAFDLVNEPTPSGTIKNWHDLAQRIIDSIRTVDNNHLIVAERAIALGCDYGFDDGNKNYPVLTEPNLMYTVHMYEPMEYTHQLFEWAGQGEGGKYPDEEKVTVPADTRYATGDYNNPSIKTGTNDWTYFTGSAFTVAHDSLIVGRVVFVSSKLAAGKVYFDDFELKELDASSNLVRTISKVNLTSGSYWWYSANSTGSYTEETIGHSDNYSVAISGNTAAASVILPQYTFKARKGYRYVISGWMKGENLPTGATANITTEYYSSPSGGKPKARNYEYIKDQIIAYAKYVEEKGYPVYFGEFGVGKPCFENGKGGEKWVADVLHVFDSLGYHFTYHSYKESAFGYYDGWERPVDTTTVNVKLQQVFRDFFGMVTGVEDDLSNLETDLKIFPNPTNDQVHIAIGKNKTFSTVEIVDMLGQIVLNSNQATIDVSNLPRGSYVARVKTGNDWRHAKFLKY